MIECIILSGLYAVSGTVLWQVRTWWITSFMFQHILLFVAKQTCWRDCHSCIRSLRSHQWSRSHEA